MHKTMMGALYWLSLVIAPLILAGMELFHPAGFTNSPGMFAYLCQPQPFKPEHWALGYFGPQWWFSLHIVQLPLLGLVSVGLWNLLSGVDDGFAGLLAWISRIATFIFLIAYTALDSIGGIGLGRKLVSSTSVGGSSGKPPSGAGAVCPPIKRRPNSASSQCSALSAAIAGKGVPMR